MQTLLASAPTRSIALRAAAVEIAGESVAQDVSTADGVRLRAWTTFADTARPCVVILHGWLGHHESNYMLSSTAALWHAGFDVVRLLLRDHGGTDHLNEEMFNSSMLPEVIDALKTLLARHTGGCAGVLGFSLGGNFALRIAAQAERAGLPIGSVLAICPLVDPASSIAALDRGATVYKHYFMRKWHRALDTKQQAFPERYDFTHTYALRGIGSTTDYFVREHTAFATPRDYFRRYTVTGNALAGLSVPTRILAAADDPVIPVADFARIDAQSLLSIDIADTGGHCGFIENLTSGCYAARYAVAWFSQAPVSR